MQAPMWRVQWQRGCAGSYHTKKEKDPVDATVTGILRNYPTGFFYKAREFYSPKYENPAASSVNSPIRTLNYILEA